jgi:hypothetical protein
MQSRAMLRTADAYLDHITHERGKDAPDVVGEPRRAASGRDFAPSHGRYAALSCHQGLVGDEFRQAGTRALRERHEARRDHEIIGRQRIWK